MNSLKTRIDQLMELRDNGAPFSEFLRLYDSTLDETGKGRYSSVAEVYQETEKKRSKSDVYTPYELSEEICKRAADAAQSSGLIVRRVLDCSVGTGNIILEYIKHAPDNISIDITDTDGYCEKVALTEIYRKYPEINVRSLGKNFLTVDGEYDLILGNPPYLGFKDMDPQSREKLRNDFPDIYSDKGDYCHAFFKKAHSLLRDGGILAFIVPRYFMESRSAAALRGFILSGFKIVFIHDFYGDRPFGAGVDPCILILKKKRKDGSYSFRAIRNDIGELTVSSDSLSESSMKILSQDEISLKERIESLTDMKLSDYGEFRQGIITGADRVFIMTDKEAHERGIEKDLLVPWIKSKDVEAGNIKDTGLRLVYPDKDEDEMAGFIKYADLDSERLSKRREVRNGVRKFYELTWGRKKEDFMKKRILFRYKSSSSTFAEGEKIFHSADIYSFIPHNEDDIPYLLRILNSDVYDVYIKSALKKLGRDLYEYYPHRLMDIHVPDRHKYRDPDEFLRELEQDHE